MASPDWIVDNPPQTLDMASFWQRLDEFGGLGKTCRYAVMIRLNTASNNNNINGVFDDLTYLCESTEFPGRGFNNVDVKGYYGPDFKMPFQTSYEDINMTFICRTESFEREVFDDWMEKINPTNTFDFEYRDNYSATITLFQMTEVEDSIGSGMPGTSYAFTLYDAYPILVNPQPVTWADDSYQRLTVAFTYSKWRRKGKDDVNDTSGSSLALFPS